MRLSASADQPLCRRKTCMSVPMCILLAGGKWEKARELFDQMPSCGCKPDAVTYSVLIATYERCQQWTAALEAWENMTRNGIHPDTAVYCSLLEVLWMSGVVAAQVRLARTPSDKAVVSWEERWETSLVCSKPGLQQAWSSAALSCRVSPVLAGACPASVGCSKPCRTAAHLHKQQRNDTCRTLLDGHSQAWRGGLHSALLAARAQVWPLSADRHAQANPCFARDSF